MYRDIEKVYINSTSKGSRSGGSRRRERAFDHSPPTRNRKKDILSLS